MKPFMLAIGLVITMALLLLLSSMPDYFRAGSAIEINSMYLVAVVMIFVMVIGAAVGGLGKQW